MSSHAKRGSFFYTLLGYLMILVFLLAIALLIGVILYRFVIVPDRIPSADAVGKWGGFILFTFITFLFVIQKSRTRWRNRMFWIVLCAVFAVHIASFLVSFRYVEPWRDWYFLVISTIEAPFIRTFLNWTFERFEKEHHLKDGAAHIG